MNFASLIRRLRSLKWPWRASSPHLRLGRRGERLARKHLRRCGYRILARNFACAAGEVDIIAARRDTIIFVEIKTRTSEQHQDILETVSRDKWNRVERAAQHYLSRRAARDVPCRFDMIAILLPAEGQPTVEHIEDAHQPRWNA